MNDLSSIIVLILSVLGNGILGYLVLRKNPKSASHIIFSVLNADLFVYAILNFLANRETDPITALFLIRILMLLAVPQVVATFLFLRTVPNERFYLPRSSFVYLTVTSIICMALALSPWLFRDVVFDNGAPLPIAGWGMIVYMPLILSMIVAGTMSVIRKFRSAQGLLRIQLTYIIIGLATMIGLFVSLNFFVVVFFKNANFTVFAPLYILFFLACSAVAMLKYRLLDTRIVFRKSLIYGVSVVFAVSIYAGFVSYLESALAAPRLVSLLVAPAILLLGFEFIKRFVRDFVDRYIFIEMIDFSFQLDLSQRFLRVRGELDEWFASFTDELRNKLSVRDASMFLHDRLNGDIVQMFPRNSFHFDERADVIEMLSSIDQPVFLSDILRDRSLSNSLKGLFHRLQKEGDVMVPLSYYGRFLGFVLLRIESGRVDVGAVACCDKKYSYRLNDIVTYFEAISRVNFG